MVSLAIRTHAPRGSPVCHSWVPLCNPSPCSCIESWASKACFWLSCEVSTWSRAPQRTWRDIGLTRSAISEDSSCKSNSRTNCTPWDALEFRGRCGIWAHQSAILGWPLCLGQPFGTGSLLHCHCLLLLQVGYHCSSSDLQRATPQDCPPCSSRSSWESSLMCYPCCGYSSLLWEEYSKCLTCQDICEENYQLRKPSGVKLLV